METLTPAFLAAQINANGISSNKTSLVARDGIFSSMLYFAVCTVTVSHDADLWLGKKAQVPRVEEIWTKVGMACLQELSAPTATRRTDSISKPSRKSIMKEYGCI